MLKKLLSSALALALVFGTAAVLPEGAVTVGTAITASAEDHGDFSYQDQGNGTVYIVEYKGNDPEVNIPDTIDGKPVTSIGIYAFNNCTGVTSVMIPKSVFCISDNAFAGCTSLTGITIPDSVTVIGNNAFYNCKKLKSIAIPDSVTSIGDGAFQDCTSLESVALSKSITSIGDRTFFYCRSLTGITIPDGVTGIGREAFYCCEKIKTISLPNTVKYIDDAAFSECTGLESINIPDGVTSIGIWSFYACKSLKSVTIPSSVAVIDTKSFGYYYDEEIDAEEYQKIDGLLIRCCSGSAAEEYAKDNDIKYELLDKPAHTHSYISKITKAATCTADGVKTYTCSCGDSYTETVKATGHKYTAKVVKPTYTSEGYTLHTCTCGESYKDNITPKLTRTSIAKATVSGLSSKTYTGKAITQTPVVKLGGKTLKAGTDYTVAYKNNKAVGTATVTITGKGAYTGSISKTFKICPKKTAIKKVTSPKTKQLKVTYGKVSGVTGYQVTYSTSSKFTKKTTKSVNVSGTAKTIGKITKGKTYYVKVRTYKTVKGVKYYSGYTAVKKIKVK